MIKNLLWIAALGLSVLLAMPSSSRADEQKSAAAPYTYGPDDCDFSITFPGEPYKEKRCDEDAKGECYNLITYTQVFNLDSSVSIKVICNPLEKELYDKIYDEKFMKSSLALTVKDRNITEVQTMFNDRGGYKQAGLLGQTVVGRTSGIFISQLWASPTSVFFVEAEMVGEQMDAADKLFADILRSVTFKQDALKDNADGADSADDIKDQPDDKPQPVTPPQDKADK